MALVAFVSVALVFGPTVSTTPLIYGFVIDEFGWTRTEVALQFSYRSLASAVATLLLAGPLLVRFGLRPVMIAAFAITSVSMIGFLAVDSLSVYYAVGVGLGVGMGLVTVATNVFVSRWFYRNQGVALGVTLAGPSVSGAVFPLIAAPLIGSIGWRAAMAGLSVFVWLVALPLYLWKAREEPSEEDLAPELDAARPRPRDVTASDQTTGAPPSGPGSRPLLALLGTATFWKAAIAVLIVATADVAIIQNTPLLLAEAGISTTLAALSLSVMFAIGILGKVLAGRVYDTLSVRGMSLWYLLLAASIALLFVVSGPITVMAFAVIRGLAHGGLIPKPAVLAKHCYGPQLMNVTLPLFLGVWLIGAGAGPAVLAVFFDASGHYRYGLALLIALCLVAAVLIRQTRPEFHGRAARVPSDSV